MLWINLILFLVLIIILLGFFVFASYSCDRVGADESLSARRRRQIFRGESLRH